MAKGWSEDVGDFMFNFQGKKLLPIKYIYVENEKNKKIKKGENNLTVNISLLQEEFGSKRESISYRGNILLEILIIQWICWDMINMYSSSHVHIKICMIFGNSWNFWKREQGVGVGSVQGIGKCLELHGLALHT